MHVKRRSTKATLYTSIIQFNTLGCESVWRQRWIGSQAWIAGRRPTGRTRGATCCMLFHTLCSIEFYSISMRWVLRIMSAAICWHRLSTVVPIVFVACLI